MGSTRPRNVADGCGLASAVRSEEAEHDPRGDLERQVIQCANRAEVAHESIRLDGDGAHAVASLRNTARTGAASSPAILNGKAANS